MNINEKKTVYCCGICNKEFDSVQERNVHEQKCLAEKASQEAEQKKKALEAEREHRKMEIEAKEKELIELQRKFMEDYGYYPSSPRTPGMNREIFYDPLAKALEGLWF